MSVISNSPDDVLAKDILLIAKDIADEIMPFVMRCIETIRKNSLNNTSLRLELNNSDNLLACNIEFESIFHYGIKNRKLSSFTIMQSFNKKFAYELNQDLLRKSSDFIQILKDDVFSLIYGDIFLKVKESLEIEDMYGDTTIIIRPKKFATNVDPLMWSEKYYTDAFYICSSDDYFDFMKQFKLHNFEILTGAQEKIAIDNIEDFVDFFDNIRKISDFTGLCMDDIEFFIVYDNSNYMRMPKSFDLDAIFTRFVDNAEYVFEKPFYKTTISSSFMDTVNYRLHSLLIDNNLSNILTKEKIIGLIDDKLGVCDYTIEDNDNSLFIEKDWYNF